MSVLSPAEDPAVSDDDSDGSSASLYEADYRPISAVAESDDDDDGAGYTPTLHLNGGLACWPPPNPSFSYDRAENGVSRLDLNGDVMHVAEEPEEGEEEEVVESEREASISRAFGEDESRRNAPLTRENAARVMEAMRGVSFPGYRPDWVDRVPEVRWIDELRRLRSGEPTPEQDC